MDRAFFELLGTVRAGGPVAAGNKTSLTPAAAASYDELMGERARVEGPALAGVLDWSRFEHVVDVGGGTGAQLIALLTVFPALRGTLVELPASVEAARKNFAGAGVTADVVGGNLFELELPKADVFILRYLLHSFEDDQAVDALRKCQKRLAAQRICTHPRGLGHRPNRLRLDGSADARPRPRTRADPHRVRRCRRGCRVVPDSRPHTHAGPRVLEYQRQSDISR